MSQGITPKSFGPSYWITLYVYIHSSLTMEFIMLFLFTHNKREALQDVLQYV